MKHQKMVDPADPVTETPSPRDVPALDPDHPSFQCWACGSAKTDAVAGELRYTYCRKGCSIPECPHKFPSLDANVTCLACGNVWVEGGGGESLKT